MAKKKKDTHKEFNRFMEQARGRFKKFGKELNVLAKKGEVEIVKATRAGKIQLDIMGLNVQKEKLYYDIGKKVASLNAKKGLSITELEPLWKKMRKLEQDARNKKKELSTDEKNK